MGVPKFFRFISERYPLIKTPLNPSSAPTIDNLYLDMNGIIHNCVRDSPGNDTADSKRYSTSAPLARKTDQQIYLDVFKYIDNLFNLMPPTRFLYMAIDGVAPRAKMNQQRARRFRSAKERVEEHERLTKADSMYAAAEVEPFDSNCITPGTLFMQKLTAALNYFVAKKLKEDIKWANIQVVLSGAEAPGEGEHKIMEYIRAMRESGKFPANIRHCVYGLDADLIMLGLVTHEPHFFIFREKVDFNNWRKKKSGPRVATGLDTTVFGEFELLSIGVLRQYLVLELGTDGTSNLPFFDTERVIDDFVFILMLVGNDFLPHLPTLEIADGTLHVMLHLYKRVLPLLGGYITKAGKIHGQRLEYFFAKLGLLEEDILKSKLEGGSARGDRGRSGTRGKTFANVDLDILFRFKATVEDEVSRKRLSPEAMREECNACRERISHVTPLKQRYYKEKFETGSQGRVMDDAGLRSVTDAYLRGIAWTLKYYTEGCRQWRWYYPEHYAPLASDIFGVDQILKEYEGQIVRDVPFRPFEQLLSVLPPESSWCLPAPYRDLMTTSASPLRDQYPDNFKLDMNGKRNSWEAVVLLPFMDEKRLAQAITHIRPGSVTRDEAARNELGPSFVLVRDAETSEVVQSPFGSHMASFASQSSREVLVLPKIAEGLAFKPKLRPGTKHAKSSDELADLPTLNEVVHSGCLESISVNVFGTPSRSQSLVVNVEDDARSEEKGAQSLSGASRDAVAIANTKEISVGSSVWCGYPWRRAATVESVATYSMTKYVRHQTQRQTERFERPQVIVGKTVENKFRTDVSAIVSSLMQRYALAISNPSQVITVRCELEPMLKENSKEGETVHYHERFVTSRSEIDAGQRGREELTRSLTKGEAVLYVGHGPYFGHRGTVVSMGSHGEIGVKFERSIAAAKEPPFGYHVISVNGSQQRWMPLSKCAAAVGMRISVVDQFLGSLRVRLSTMKEEIDLGLGVKYVGRGLCIPGFSRRDDRNCFLFSQACVDVLKSYIRAFPSLFAAVDRIKGGNARSVAARPKGAAVYEGHELYPDLKNSDDAIKAVATWIASQDVASLPLVSVQADVLGKSVVHELERHCSIALELQREYDQSMRKGSHTMFVREVPRRFLLTGREPVTWDSMARENDTKPVHAPVPADGSGVRLGDRVVNRIGTGGVPLGMRGSVIGIHPSESLKQSNREDTNEPRELSAVVEVCFDEGFIGGGSLKNRCTKGRGKAVPASSLFIIRPDRENSFYVKNYAKAAARVGVALRGKMDEEGHSENSSKAIARAAVESYAAAAKKNASKQISIVSTTKERVNGRTEGRSLPQNGGAPEQRAPISGGNAVPDSQYLEPEQLPLPSFLYSKPPGSVEQNRSSVAKTNISRTAPRGSSRDEKRKGEPSSKRGKSTGVNRDKAIDDEASQVAMQLRKALRVSSDDGATGEKIEDRAEATSRPEKWASDDAVLAVVGDDEDFAALWRQLQDASGNRQGSSTNSDANDMI